MFSKRRYTEECIFNNGNAYLYAKLFLKFPVVIIILRAAKVQLQSLQLNYDSSDSLKAALSTSIVTTGNILKTPNDALEINLCLTLFVFKEQQIN